MTRRVELLPRAKHQLYAAARWWAEHRSVEQAARWLTGMELAITSLGADAERFPLAAEATVVGVPIREVHFGISGRPTHRVVFEVEDDRVLIYAIRHLAQRDLTAEDIL